MSATPEVLLPIAPQQIPDLKPVSPLERIQTIDILRGFALFGVLAANMKGFSLPFLGYYGLGGQWPLSQLDKAVDLFILFFIKGKCISLFSFLFGLGLAVQLSRAEARGVDVVPRYRRRLTVLLIIGVAHIAFFWVGDVLHTYALVGFILLLYRNVSLKWSKRIIVICFLALFLPMAAFFLFGPGRLPTPEKDTVASEMQEEVRVYLHGSYGEQMLSRWHNWKRFTVSPRTFGYYTDLLGVFLMGLYAGKRRIFQEVEQNREFIRKVMWWGLGLGLGSAMVFVPNVESSRWISLCQASLRLLGNFLFLFYAAGLTLLIHSPNPRWRVRLSHLAPVGRMALTNYLTQTIVCTTIFYGYGLGYFGKMGSAVGLLLSIILFGAQIFTSAWWLRHFEFGPAEWVWRSLTYGRLQPMLIKKTS